MKMSHHNDAIMGTIESQITNLTIVYSAVYSDADQRKHQSSASPGTGEFPAQMASNAENVSIWWRHHGIAGILSPSYLRSEISYTSKTTSLYWIRALVIAVLYMCYPELQKISNEYRRNIHHA